MILIILLISYLKNNKFKRKRKKSFYLEKNNKILTKIFNFDNVKKIYANINANVNDYNNLDNSDSSNDSKSLNDCNNSDNSYDLSYLSYHNYLSDSDNSSL